MTDSNQPHVVPPGDPVPPAPRPELPPRPTSPSRPHPSAPPRWDAIGPTKPAIGPRGRAIPPAADVAPLVRRLAELEKKLLSFAAMNLVLATLLRQRRLLDDAEFEAVVLAANKIHEKGQPQTFEELLRWARESR